jgi:hypothetical protein
MDKENVYIHDGVLLTMKKDINVICRKVDGAGDHHAKQDQPDPEINTTRSLSYAEFRPKEKKNMNVKGELLFFFAGWGRMVGGREKGEGDGEMNIIKCFM